MENFPEPKFTLQEIQHKNIVIQNIITWFKDMVEKQLLQPYQFIQQQRFCFFQDEVLGIRIR